jgi:IS30 family transposase
MVDAMEEVLKTIPKEQRITLTVDNGREFAYHTMVTYLSNTQIYFAHPYASYER